MKKILLLSALVLSCVRSALAGGGDIAVDLQWAVCDASPEAVLAKIDHEEMKGPRLGTVTYYDSDSATYLLDGVSFRRKTEENDIEASVKIRYSSYREIPEAECSWDRYGEAQVFTCELAAVPTSGGAWTAGQAEFLSRRYRPVDTASLRAFGPYSSRKWHFKFKDYKVSFDSVDAGSGGQLMEFSLKVPVSEADHFQEKFTAWLAKREIVLCPRQKSKIARLFRSLGILPCLLGNNRLML